MCGLFLKGPESRSGFEEARSLEVLTPGGYNFSIKGKKAKRKFQLVKPGGQLSIPNLNLSFLVLLNFLEKSENFEPTFFEKSEKLN